MAAAPPETTVETVTVNGVLQRQPESESAERDLKRVVDKAEREGKREGQSHRFDVHRGFGRVDPAAGTEANAMSAAQVCTMRGAS
eukprot:3399561-Rhodomonas_salina.3